MFVLFSFFFNANLNKNNILSNLFLLSIHVKSRVSFVSRVLIANFLQLRTVSTWRIRDAEIIHNRKPRDTIVSGLASMLRNC